MVVMRTYVKDRENNKQYDLDQTVEEGNPVFYNSKKFWRTAASGIKTKSIVDTKMLTRESLKQPLTELNLGPLLPNMEKNIGFHRTRNVE